MTTESNPQMSETTAAPRDGIAEKGLSVNSDRPTQPVSHEVAIAYIHGGNPPARPVPRLLPMLLQSLLPLPLPTDQL